MADSLASAIGSFRAWSWAVSPAFGREIDSLIIEGVGFADAAPSTGSAVLDKLVSGLASAATAAQLGIKSYYDAMTQVNLIQQAHAAGLLTDNYVTPIQMSRATGAVATDKSSAAGANVFGVPIWMILAGVGLVLVMRR